MLNLTMILYVSFHRDDDGVVVVGVGVGVGIRGIFNPIKLI
jgi:hypothetical protein